MATTDHLLERARSRPPAPPPAGPMPGGRPRATGEDAPRPSRASLLTISCERHGSTVLLVLAGPLDTYTTPAFRQFVTPFDPPIQLVIDLAAVTLLDSAGLGALLSLRNEAHRAGRRLGLVCPDRRLTRLFWFTGLRPAFVFGDDLAAVRAALAAYEGEPVRAGAVQAG
jgi:anti-sigma B factor antagonist